MFTLRIRCCIEIETICSRVHDDILKSWYRISIYEEWCCTIVIRCFNSEIEFLVSRNCVIATKTQYPKSNMIQEDQINSSSSGGILTSECSDSNDMVSIVVSTRIEVVSILKWPSSAATPEFCWHPQLERLVRRYVYEIHIQGIAGGRARSSWGNDSEKVSLVFFLLDQDVF